MTQYIYIENGILNGAGMAKQIGENIINLEVSEDIFNDFISDKLKYTYADGKIIKNPNYETEKQKMQNQNRIEEVLTELEMLDKKRIRAACENELKDPEHNITWLDYYNEQISILRNELRELKSA